MAATKKDFADYQSAVVTATAETTKLDDQEEYKKLGEVVRNHLLDLPGPKVLHLQLSDYEKFLQKVFYGFFEIFDSYERLLDLEVYMRKFPFKNTRITKVQYLRFTIEAYFEEIYLLKERLLSYLKVIQRLYRNSRNKDKAERAYNTLSTLVEKVLESLTRVRGYHVHVYRYSDYDIDRLKSLEFFALNVKEVNFKELYQLEYRDIRQKRLRFIKETNGLLRKLLDRYFGALFGVVFDEAGKIIYPKAK